MTILTSYVLKVHIGATLLKDQFERLTESFVLVIG